MAETVWAIHKFEAEADDEISFNVDEPIIVTQKDELYQDGWWEGTNVRGETGLFPMNYTSPDPPEHIDSPPVSRINASPNNSNNNNNAVNNNTGNNLDNRGHGNASVHSMPNTPPNHIGSPGHNSIASSMASMHLSQQSPAMSGGRSGFTSPAPNTSGSNSKAIAQAVEESLNDPQLSGHPTTWSIDQVSYWLRWIGFDSVIGSFQENEISGAILLELNLNNLKELDIASFGKRFNIMNAITSLKQLTKSNGLSKGLFGLDGGSGGGFPNGHGPNIPPRMTSAGGPSPRASFDPRSDYMPDPRSPPMQPASSYRPSQSQLPPHHQSQPQHHNQHHNQHQHQPEYDAPPQSRNAALARSDTIGSLASGGSMGDYSMPSNEGRGGQRQSMTSAYSSTSNPRRNNQWDRQPPPQVPTSPIPSQQARSVNGMPEESMYGRPMDAMNDNHYPRAMDRTGPTSPDLDMGPQDHFHTPVPQPRAAPPKPDNHPRHPSGKADPANKVVSLDIIGRPDYAGWLKKRGDGAYRTWKSRWFMLKGVTLYYMNSPKDNASKDYIDLVGYKIVQDENIYAGKYCFKAVHDELRSFYFYTDSESDMKGWLKALMKVTIGRDPSAPVISSSNIPTIPLHVAQRMQPRPPSPSKRNRGMGPNGPPMHPQQAQHQQQYDQKFQQKQQMQQQQQQQQQQNNQMQLLDYDDQESEADEYLQHDYGQPKYNNHQGANGHAKNDHGDESPVLQSKTLPGQQQRHSFVQNGHGDDDPWREEDDEGFGRQPSQPKNRPDSELDSYRHGGPMQQSGNGRMTQEEYVAWINRNLPDNVEPVTDMIQSLRSGVVLVRLVESLSGEFVDKKIPNATYTLQMLENLLAAFKFMDRVGISTEGYTVKDVFNGIEDKIVLMFESIRQRFPNDASSARGGNHHPMNNNSNNTSMTNARASPSQRSQASSGKSPRLGNDNAYLPQQRSNSPRMNIGSEYEALYEEAARSTIA
ncbi:polar growth protein [Actinomortierella ambigua]|nr:polar growth protein [Actinomortierella ambigua]